MIEMVKIATVKNDVNEATDSNWGDIVSEIVLEDEYSDGLANINSFSHLIIVTYLHQADFNIEDHLQRYPRDNPDLPITGIFAQRAKHRPNPIGLTSVKLISSDTNTLRVSGLDVINGTPVLDIKPYVPAFDGVKNPVVPNWMEEIMKNYFD